MAQEFQSRIIELTDSALSDSITADALIRLVNDIENQSPPKEIIHLLAVPEIKSDTLQIEAEPSIPEKSPEPSPESTTE